MRGPEIDPQRSHRRACALAQDALSSREKVGACGDGRVRREGVSDRVAAPRGT
ncbi:hypothetical protein DB32_001684 [Sandaracinus amylolyticus]|uniref:Uncharacterized protein n=1 Tax=Sandaracinus amylolyticus TaxID=927083 RepID=A0A0F6YI00_9BACT|nr:hypothetical protein DB32_001684 [Sandaracinus amylolyticus]